MKLKHEATLESLDKLTADYEELKRKIGYVDEEKKQLLANIKHREVTHFNSHNLTHFTHHIFNLE